MKIRTWEDKIRIKHPQSPDRSPYWDFQHKGNRHFTIDPGDVPPRWNDITQPENVFEVPEIWYGVEKIKSPLQENAPFHEVEFVRSIWEKYSDKPLHRIFEVCCGISPHGSILAGQGYQVVGVDSSSGMIEALNARVKAQELDIKAYRRDIFQFSIPGDPPDGAILLGRTFPLSRNNKTDNSALASQLRSVGTFLRRNTLYVIDCGNPEPPTFIREYAFQKPDTIDLGFAQVTLTHRVFPTDVETLATPFVTGYHVQYPSGRVRLENRGAKSFVSPQHLSALVEMSQLFTLEAFHHWGNTEPGLARDGGPYMAVLRRI